MGGAHRSAACGGPLTKAHPMILTLRHRNESLAPEHRRRTPPPIRSSQTTVRFTPLRGPRLAQPTHCFLTAADSPIRRPLAPAQPLLLNRSRSPIHRSRSRALPLPSAQSARPLRSPHPHPPHPLRRRSSVAAVRSRPTPPGRGRPAHGNPPHPRVTVRCPAPTARSPPLAPSPPPPFLSTPRWCQLRSPLDHLRRNQHPTNSKPHTHTGGGPTAHGPQNPTTRSNTPSPHTGIP